MPCYDGREREDEQHNNASAEVLCKLLRDIEKIGGEAGIPEYARQWWAEHKKRDAGRT